jgi:Rod binding domain-containing protein
MGQTLQLAAIGGAIKPAQAENAPSPRLVRAAHEFEGQMMQQLLKPMTDGDGLSGADGDEDSGAGSGGALREFASEALGQSLSQRGGLGIAKQIIQELSHTGNKHEGGKVPKNLHDGHGVRTAQ